MKLFLDSADIKSIELSQKYGLIDGITTNPTLLSKQISKETGSADITEIILTICKILKNNSVSVEITEKEPEKVYKQALEIANLAPNVVVKIPCYKPYFQIINKLVKNKISINITLIFSFNQALLMSKLGVKYISPFIGRLNDIDNNGLELIQDLVIAKKNYHFKTEILAASVRSVEQVHTLALLGADIATIPVEIFEKLADHPLTAQGMDIFEKDWQKLKIKNFPQN